MTPKPSVSVTLPNPHFFWHTATVGKSKLISIPILAGKLTEGTETLTITLDDYQDKSTSVIVNDTSISSTHNLSAVYDSHNEGTTAYFSLTADGVDAWTLVAYTISGVRVLTSGTLSGELKPRSEVQERTSSIARLAAVST